MTAGTVTQVPDKSSLGIATGTLQPCRRMRQKCSQKLSPRLGRLNAQFQPCKSDEFVAAFTSWRATKKWTLAFVQEALRMRSSAISGNDRVDILLPCCSGAVMCIHVRYSVSKCHVIALYGVWVLCHCSKIHRHLTRLHSLHFRNRD